MTDTYLRYDHSNDPVAEPVVNNLYLVVNVKSEYFGTTIEEADRTYLNEENSQVLWIKDLITGLWFRCTELEQTFLGSMDEENMQTLEEAMREESRVKYDPRDPNDEGDGIPDI